MLALVNQIKKKRKLVGKPSELVHKPSLQLLIGDSILAEPSGSVRPPPRSRPPTTKTGEVGVHQARRGRGREHGGCPLCLARRWRESKSQRVRSE